jgi:hypothetical protein
MDPKWATMFFALGLVFFLLDAFDWRPRVLPVSEWTPLGLACFIFPFLYGAAVAGW